MDWLTEGELLATGADRGSLVSPRQLRRWRAKGLIDFKRLRPGRGRGSQTRYPPHAVDQLVAAHNTVRRGRDLDVSVVLAAAYTTLELHVPVPPGFGEALRSLNTTLRRFSPEQAGFGIEQHVRKRGVPGVRGMSRGDLGEAMGLLAERLAGRAEPLDEAGLSTLVQLTDQLSERMAKPLTVSKQFVVELWSTPVANPTAVEQATRTATSSELVEAITTAAQWMLEMPWPRRRSADQVASVLAELTCKALLSPNGSHEVRAS